MRPPAQGGEARRRTSRGHAPPSQGARRMTRVERAVCGTVMPRIDRCSRATSDGSQPAARDAGRSGCGGAGGPYCAGRSISAMAMQ